MATRIVAPGGAIPASIKKEQRADCDMYFGSASDLIAAGLVRADQFPPEGRLGISYLGDKPIRGNHRKDETYLRVEHRCWGDYPFVVYIGASREEALARKAAQDLRHRKEAQAKKQKELAEAADRAKRDLKNVWTSEDDYRRDLVKRARTFLKAAFGEEDRPATWHAYRLDQEGKEAILMSLDAVIEAIMGAPVHFDAAFHARLVGEHQATIRAVDPSFYNHLDKLVEPNASILKGEAL